MTKTKAARLSALKLNYAPWEVPNYTCPILDRMKADGADPRDVELVRAAMVQMRALYYGAASLHHGPATTEPADAMTRRR